MILHHEADVLANVALVARHPILRNARRGASLWKRLVRVIIGSELLLARLFRPSQSVQLLAAAAPVVFEHEADLVALVE